MAKILFPLRYVPEKEAQTIRDVLDQHEIDWYETHAGNWGIAVPAIWLRDESQWEEARAVLDEFQAQLTQEVQELYQQQIESGENQTMLSILREKPVIFLAALAGIGLIGYFSIMPFFSMLPKE